MKMSTQEADDSFWDKKKNTPSYFQGHELKTFVLGG